MFPRTIIPREVSPFRMPSGLISIGQTGKSQRRAVVAIGREWDELFPPMKVGTPNVDALLAYVEDAWNRKTSFTIDHRASAGSGRARHGSGGGAPAVSGASQTGGTLTTSGWTPGSGNVMRAGDVFTIAGVPWMLRVLADANSDGAGVAPIAISPPFPAGSSPGDGAAITHTGALLTAYLAAPPVLPPIPPGHYLSGLTLTFHEAL